MKKKYHFIKVLDHRRSSTYTRKYTTLTLFDKNFHTNFSNAYTHECLRIRNISADRVRPFPFFRNDFWSVSHIQSLSCTYANSSMCPCPYSYVCARVHFRVEYKYNRIFVMGVKGVKFIFASACACGKRGK